MPALLWVGCRRCALAPAALPSGPSALRTSGRQARAADAAERASTVPLVGAARRDDALGLHAPGRAPRPPTTYDEAWNRTVEYASAIRAAFPDLEVHGPHIREGARGAGGAPAMPEPHVQLPRAPPPPVGLVRGLEQRRVQSPGTCLDGPDRAAHGGAPFIQWLLQQLAAYHAATGVLLITHLSERRPGAMALL